MYQIAKRLARTHQVTIVSRKSKSRQHTTTHGNLKIIRVSSGSPQQYLTRALHAVRGHSFDYIQIDNRPRFIRSVKKAFPHTPISVFLHSTTFLSPPMTTRAKAAKDLQHASAIIGNSRSLRAWIQQQFPSVHHKVHYVHLGVDVNHFKPTHKKLNAPFTILFAGRLIPRKGIPVLMKATQLVRANIPNVRLHIAGGSHHAKYKHSLQQLAATLGINVTFKGYVSRNQMPNFFRSGHCFVCPSQKHEAFGLVNVEAMASGIPTIASQIGGIPEIIQHQSSGLLIKNYRSPHAFAKAINRIATEPAFAARISKQGRKVACHKFSWQATARELNQLYAKSSN